MYDITKGYPQLFCSDSSNFARCSYFFRQYNRFDVYFLANELRFQKSKKKNEKQKFSKCGILEFSEIRCKPLDALRIAGINQINCFSPYISFDWVFVLVKHATNHNQPQPATTSHNQPQSFRIRIRGHTFMTSA